MDFTNSMSMHPLPLMHIHQDSSDRVRSRSQSMQPSTTHRKGASSSHEPSPSNQGDTTGRPSAGANAHDVEGQEEQFTQATDPFSLSTKYKSSDEITNLRRFVSKKRSIGGLSATQPSTRARAIQSFYEEQNESITRLLKPVSEHRRLAKIEQDSDSLRFKIAVNGSFVANILLAGLQLYGAISSGSLSLFTTMADAIFDPLSNLTLILSNRAVNKVDPRKFPSGKARIENAGNIVFCFLMTSVSFILIVLSIMELAEGSQAATKGFKLPSVIAVAVAFATKLGLFLYCWALRNRYSQIRILWEDHRNDLFINGFGILTSVGGSKLRWWIDPMGAVLLSVLISVLWLSTAYKEFMLLIGVSADTATLRLITYICTFRSPSATFNPPPFLHTPHAPS